MCCDPGPCFDALLLCYEYKLLGVNAFIISSPHFITELVAFGTIKASHSSWMMDLPCLMAQLFYIEILGTLGLHGCRDNDDDDDRKQMTVNSVAAETGVGMRRGERDDRPGCGRIYAATKKYKKIKILSGRL